MMTEKEFDTNELNNQFIEEFWTLCAKYISQTRASSRQETNLKLMMQDGCSVFHPGVYEATIENRKADRGKTE